jgi:hypothetical protein
MTPVSTDNMIIGEKEAKIRQGVGLAIMTSVAALAVLKGPAAMGPAGFSVLFGSGIVVFETGRVNL